MKRTVTYILLVSLFSFIFLSFYNTFLSSDDNTIENGLEKDSESTTELYLEPNEEFTTVFDTESNEVFTTEFDTEPNEEFTTGFDTEPNEVSTTEFDTEPNVVVFTLEFNKEPKEESTKDFKLEPNKATTKESSIGSTTDTKHDVIPIATIFYSTKTAILNHLQDSINQALAFKDEGIQKSGLVEYGVVKYYNPDNSWFGVSDDDNFISVFEEFIARIERVVLGFEKDVEKITTVSDKASSWDDSDYYYQYNVIIEQLQLRLSELKEQSRNTRIEVVKEFISRLISEYSEYLNRFKALLDGYYTGNQKPTTNGIEKSLAEETISVEVENYSDEVSTIDVVINDTVTEDVVTNHVVTNDAVPFFICAFSLSIVLYWILREGGWFYFLFICLSVIWIGFIHLTTNHIVAVRNLSGINVVLAPLVSVAMGGFFAGILCPPRVSAKAKDLYYRKVRYVNTRLKHILLYLIICYAGFFALFAFLYYLPKVFFPILFCFIVIILFIRLMDDLDDYYTVLIIVGLCLLALSIWGGIKIGTIVSPAIHQYSSGLSKFVAILCYFTGLFFEAVSRKRHTFLYSRTPIRYCVVQMEL